MIAFNRFKRRLIHISRADTSLTAVRLHEQASTTLNLYTHGSAGQDARVRNALADFSLTSEIDNATERREKPSEEGS